MSGDRPLLGIALMLGFCALAPLGDSIAKIIGDAVPLAQLLAVRFGVQAVVLLPLLAAGGQRLAWSRRVLCLTALRIVGIGAMFLALRHMPLADAVAIAFVMPFLMLLLGRAFLGERVGWRRTAGCMIGFAGTLLVLRPSLVEVGAVALLPLLVAVAFALFMLVTRLIARDTDPVALQAVSGTMAAAALTAAVVLGGRLGWPPLAAVVPGTGLVALMLLLGVIGTVAHLLMTWSLRLAPTATVAPMQYAEIGFATVIGYWLFGDLPDGIAVAGILLTVAAGVFVLESERRIALRASRAT